MTRATQVHLGGWDEHFIFTDEKDAFNFWQLAKKARRASTEYFNSNHVAIPKSSVSPVLQEMDMYTKEELESIKAEQEKSE